MDCGTPGSPVLHYLLVFAQTHVHWASDAILSISSSVIPFSSCPQSFPTSGSFPINRLFASGGQSIGASALVHPMNMKDWLVWSPCSTRDSQDSQESSPKPQFINSLALSLLCGPILISIYDSWKNHSFDYIWMFVSKVTSLLFNTLSRFDEAFLPRSKYPLTSWFQLLSSVILEKSITLLNFLFFSENQAAIVANHERWKVIQ